MQDHQQSGENPLAQTQQDQVPTPKLVPDQAVAKASKPEPPRHSTSGSKTEASQGGKPFADIAPYQNEVDPAALLDAICNLIRRFMVMSLEQSHAATLWIAMTWFIDVIMVAPLAIITAPERECGKSILLEIFSRLVARPLSVANSSAAFLFRAIQAWVVTLLVDEADMFARQNDELKGLINAGHTRASAFVGRVVKVGDALEPRTFSVWCPKALAGIRLNKHLPDATMSRGIIFNLRRKRPEERAERLRHADPAEFELLASMLARFAADYAEQVRQARPELPNQLGDRAQDNWEPLFAIAACAGPKWVEYARAAALALSAIKTDENIGSELHGATIGEMNWADRTDHCFAEVDRQRQGDEEVSPKWMVAVSGKKACGGRHWNCVTSLRKEIEACLLGSCRWRKSRWSSARNAECSGIDSIRHRQHCGCSLSKCFPMIEPVRIRSVGISRSGLPDGSWQSD
jgi:hypothetical protein